MNALNARNAFSTQIIVALLLALAMPRLAEAGSNGSQKAVGPEAQQKLAKVQIPFIPNRGQSSKEVKFTARTFAGTVSVTETGGLVYSLPKLKGEKPVQGVTLKEELIGGKVKEVIGESQAVTRVSYFRGNDRSKWQSNLPSYERVSLGEVYQGIDVKLKAYGNNVEKLFYVKPGAEPETIKMKFSGRENLSINLSGELEVETEQGPVGFSKPVAYQEQEGKREPVEVAYVIRGNEYSFKVGDYDRSKELVIDPFLAATYLGGAADSHNEYIYALVLDSMGNVYVAGETDASDFPGGGPASADSLFAGGVEGFVVKLNSDMSSILAATFLGGSGSERAKTIALDSTGNVYVAGITNSPDFPGVGPDSADNSPVNGFKGYVAKLSSELSSVLAATYLSGSGYAEPDALVVDTTGNVYVTCSAYSPGLPGVGPGSADNTFSELEVYVAKLDSDLRSVLAATFLGGSGGDWSEAVALDRTGNIYVAGRTASPDFPGISPSSADSTFGGFGEGFVAKLNSDLSSILAATFLGGSGADSVNTLGLDSAGNIYSAGVTSGGHNDVLDFPGIGPGSAFSDGHKSDGFVAKLNSNLSSILAATFLGVNAGAGPGADARALALDQGGNVYVTGYTNMVGILGVGPGSADSTPDDHHGDGYITKLNSDLSSILVATYLGGSGSQRPRAIALDSKGNVYVAGDTDSADVQGISPSSADSAFGGLQEGFVAKLDANLSSGLELINDKVNFVVQSTSLSSTPVSGGRAGVYTITAQLTNKSQQNILEPIQAAVKRLTNGKLLSATEGEGGDYSYSKQAIDAGTDDILKPNESVTVQFRIGLANRSPFTFLVDVLGAVNGGQ